MLTKDSIIISNSGCNNFSFSFVIIKNSIPNYPCGSSTRIATSIYNPLRLNEDKQILPDKTLKNISEQRIKNPLFARNFDNFKGDKSNQRVSGKPCDPTNALFNSSSPLSATRFRLNAARFAPAPWRYVLSRGVCVRQRERRAGERRIRSAATDVPVNGVHGSRNRYRCGHVKIMLPPLPPSPSLPASADLNWCWRSPHFTDEFREAIMRRRRRKKVH